MNEKLDGDVNSLLQSSGSMTKKSDLRPSLHVITWQARAMEFEERVQLDCIEMRV